MTQQCLISENERWDRYYKMRRQAASELSNFVHALCADEDVYDRFELATLWRLSCEGMVMTDQTWEQMIEATDS